MDRDGDKHPEDVEEDEGPVDTNKANKGCVEHQIWTPSQEVYIRKAYF